MFVLKSMKVMVHNDRQEGRSLFGGGELAVFADAAASKPAQVNQSLSLK